MNTVQGVTLKVEPLTFDAVDSRFEGEPYHFSHEQGSVVIIRLDELSKSAGLLNELWVLLEEDETLPSEELESIKSGNFTFLMLSVRD